MSSRANGPGRSPARFRLPRLCALLLLLGGCSGRGSDDATSKDATVSRPIEQVLEEHTPRLMRIAGVVGVGQALCAGAPCIRVYIVDQASAAQLPKTLDGYAVSPVVTGTIRPTG